MKPKPYFLEIITENIKKNDYKVRFILIIKLYLKHLLHIVFFIFHKKKLKHFNQNYNEKLPQFDDLDISGYVRYIIYSTSTI